MSMWAISQAWDCDVSPQTKLALLAIADNTFQDERDATRGLWPLSFNCFEDYARLAQKCGMKPWHFGEIVRHLKYDGVLRAFDAETAHIFERQGFFVHFHVLQIPEDDEA